ncbi:MAG: M24 family metallopeptidase [Hyphomicrobiaceae bacterium]
MTKLAEERRGRLREAMKAQGLDAVVVCGTSWQEAYLRYVTDFGILEGNGICVLEADGRCRLWLESAADAERAAGETQGCEIRFTRDPAQVAGAEIRSLSNARVAVLPSHLKPAWLEDAELRLDLQDAGQLIERLFMEKMPAEIDAIRRAVRLADAGYAYFREVARPGRRQYEVVADVEAYLRANGSPDNFQIIGSGGQDVRGMTPPSERRLAAGDLVTTELTPALEGYFAQICRTLVLGKASAAHRKAFDVYLDAMEAGIAAVRAGVTAADVARAENDVFRRHGLGDYVTSRYTRVRGHGLGLMPDMKPAILEDVEIELKAGMTLIVHPNTYHPDVGYLVLGDVVAVTETGCEVLTKTPRELFEVAA